MLLNVLGSAFLVLEILWRCLEICSAIIRSTFGRSIKLHNKQNKQRLPAQIPIRCAAFGRLKDHLHTVQVYFQAPFRKFSGMGSPFPCMVCRGSHWKALKNATDLLPKTAGGVAEIITAWSPDARHEKNHGTSQPELYMAIKLFNWRFQPVCSLEIEGPELQDMAPGNKFFLQFLVHWGVFAHSNCGNTTLFVSQKQLQ